MGSSICSTSELPSLIAPAAGQPRVGKARIAIRADRAWLRDQAHPSRAAPEALGIDGRVFPDHEAFRDAHAAVNDDLRQPRRAAISTLGSKAWSSRLALG